MRLPKRAIAMYTQSGRCEFRPRTQLAAQAILVSQETGSKYRGRISLAAGSSDTGTFNGQLTVQIEVLLGIIPSRGWY
jgi:hypothetical protein